MISKTINVKSKTHYYEPERTRLFNRVPNSYSFTYKSQRATELYIRSYFEDYENNLKGGYTCFLTLTYNRAGLPTFLGLPCFNNEHINKLIHALRNRMHRKYDCDFRYLITKEYGSKRSRPHYHALFFVDSALKCPCRIFVDEVKELWQGSIDFHHGDYKKMYRGLVYAGKHFGEVTSHFALEYTCKYAVKDLTARRFEARALNRIVESVVSRSNNDYLLSLVDDYANQYDEDGNRVWSSYLISCGLKQKDIAAYTHEEISLLVNSICKDKRFLRWLQHDENCEIFALYKSFRLKYSCKPQKSNELGLSAVTSHCLNKDNGTLCIWRGRKVKVVPVPLYIYRKLFYEKPFVDENTGNVKYILNEDGINYKVNKYKEYRSKVINDFMTAKSYCLEHKDKFLEFCTQFTESDLTRFLDVSRICDFVVIYYGRYYSSDSVPPIRLEDDLRFSLQNSYYNTHFRNVVYSDNKYVLNGFTSYAKHPSFSDLDLDLDLYFSIVDFHFMNYDSDMEHNHELYKRIKEYRNSLTYKIA